MAEASSPKDKVTRLVPRRRRPAPEDHAWLVPHLIALVTYAERHGLTEVEGALAEAAERIAPLIVPPPATGDSQGGPALVRLDRLRKR